jgi:DNA-binding response OmpR family regulator
VAIRCLLVENDAQISQLLDDYLTRFGMKMAVAPGLGRELEQPP